jgi:hypothetical protein
VRGHRQPGLHRARISSGPSPKRVRTRKSIAFRRRSSSDREPILYSQNARLWRKHSTIGRGRAPRLVL